MTRPKLALRGERDRSALVVIANDQQPDEPEVDLAASVSMRMRVIQVCSSRVADGEFVAVALARSHRKSRMTVRSGGHDHAVPVDDAGFIDAIDELDAHAFTAPELERRAEVTRRRPHGIGTASYDVSLEPQHPRFRIRPDRYATRCGDQPYCYVGCGQSGGECTPQLARQQQGTRSGGQRLHRPPPAVDRILVRARRFASQDFRGIRYRSTSSITSGRSHSAGPT